MIRTITAVVGLFVIAIGVVALREATQSTHSPLHPDSSLEVVVDVSTNRHNEAYTVREMATAQVFACRLEVSTDTVGELDPLPDDPTRFRFVVRPALDETDRRQFRGCIEDWTIDHLRLRVVSFDQRGPVS